MGGSNKVLPDHHSVDKRICWIDSMRHRAHQSAGSNLHAVGVARIDTSCPLRDGFPRERIRAYLVEGVSGISLGDGDQINTPWGTVRPVPEAARPRRNPGARRTKH